MRRGSSSLRLRGQSSSTALLEMTCFSKEKNVLRRTCWVTVAKRKARMSTQSLLIIIVVVVYKINCMQKRINVATRYALRAKTPHPTLQNTPSCALSLSCTLLSLLSSSAHVEKCITLHLLLLLFLLF